MAMRGLVVFISDIRNCQSKEAEQKRIDKEMANIRQKFSKPADLNGYQRKKYVWKILYMFMLGYEVDFGHMESVGLISSPKYSEKMVGYMACSLLLREGDELLRLIINSIKNDLTSNHDNFMCLAMGSICTVGGREFAETLAGDVQKILLDSRTKVFVRKKAALTLLRLYRKNQECCNPAEIASRVLDLLDDSNLGLLTSLVNLILGFCAFSVEGWDEAPRRAVGLLTRVVVNKEYSNDYLYYGLPSPWLQIRLLRLITYFPPLERDTDGVLIDRLVTVLQLIISKTEVTKNVNKNNATHAVLFEAIQLIIHMGPSTDLLPQAVALLGRFISIREANIRYLGLETMSRLSQHPDCAGDIKRHQSTILFSLKDADVSIRRRALDLVYSMCDHDNCRETIKELLTYLANADFALREELVLKIAILAERFADDLAWYVRVVLQLIQTAGEQVSEEIWYRVVQIITNEEQLQQYATETVFKALLDDARPPENLLRICAYLLGEFSHLIAESEGMDARAQLEALNAHMSSASLPTRALLLSTFTKLAHIEPSLEEDVARVLRPQRAAIDQEVQQRALEYTALSSPEFVDLKATVLDMMPAFPERESAVLKRIKGHITESQSEGIKKTDVVMDKIEQADKREGRAPPGGGGGRGAAPEPDLLGAEEPEPAPQPAPPPPQPAGGIDDMLGGLDLGGGGGAGAAPPPPQPQTAGGGGGADDLLGDLDLGGGGGAAVAPAAPVQVVHAPIDVAGLMSAGSSAGTAPDGGPLETPTFISLCVRNEGVLFEDDLVQVGLKAEYQGHQGRVVLYYGNKAPTPLMQFHVAVEQAEGVSVQASIVPQSLQPRQQMQQMLQVECTAPFAKPPALRLSFAGGMTNRSLLIKLPLAPTKFCQPLGGLSQPAFFERWNGLGGPHEAQAVCDLREKPQNMNLFNELSAKGLKLAVLPGIDPLPTNLVASGCLALKGRQQSECPFVMLRIEINVPQSKARVTVRSTDGGMSQFILREVVETVGTA
mmetsp:Transcript_2698/g.7705  ORF Transcript_2698/g.7705 Transcript_2698/m.7705 type:complete len:1005 (+) Transcript_2698:224-3238(+)